MPYKDRDKNRDYQREWRRRQPRMTPEQLVAHRIVNARWRASLRAEGRADLVARKRQRRQEQRIVAAMPFPKPRAAELKDAPNPILGPLVNEPSIGVMNMDKKQDKTTHRKMIWEGIVEWADYSDGEKDEKGRLVPHLKAAPHRITIEPNSWLKFWIGLPNDSNPGQMQYFSTADIGEVEEEHISRQAIRDLVAKLESVDDKGLLEENSRLTAENLQLEQENADLLQQVAELNRRMKQVSASPGAVVKTKPKKEREQSTVAAVPVPTTLGTLAKPVKVLDAGTEVPVPALNSANPKPRLTWSEKEGRMVIDGEVPRAKVRDYQSYQERES